MEDIQRWYSGCLIVSGLSAEMVAEIEALGKDNPMFDVSQAMIEIEWRGRDTNLVVVRILQKLARIVRNAKGEVRCEIAGDVDQLWFEFFFIRDGRLFRQRGDVVRRPEEEVVEPSSGST
jgi:hypothetical protein